MSEPTKDRILDEWTTVEINKLRNDLRAANEQSRADSERFAKEREDLRVQIEDRRSRYRELAREAGYTGDTAEHSDVIAWAQDQKVLVAALRARVDVPYRPGLPSVEQVRAHQKRVPMGTWQMRYTEKQCWPEWRQFFVIRARSKSNGTPVEADCIGMQSSYGLLPLDPSGEPVECRPCTSDGTPLPWAKE